MKIAIISIGFFGDGILAGSFCENLKLNGCDRVDLFIRFPQIYELLKDNPYIDNLYMLPPNGINESHYDKVYTWDKAEFGVKPIDTINKHFNLKKLKYDFDLNVPDIKLKGNPTKYNLAFHEDERSTILSYGGKRNMSKIIEGIQDKYNIYFIGKGKHNEYIPNDFINNHCAIIKQCDLFFGYPGGMHWIAAGLKVPTITVSEFIMNHYQNTTQEFRSSDFDLFQKKWMWHANKHFNETHTLLPPDISEENIIKILNSL
jgi:ADP-heptose:LPS heptosyltransferase